MNGSDANTPADAVYVVAGSTVTWTYIVTSDCAAHGGAHRRQRHAGEHGRRLQPDVRRRRRQPQRQARPGRDLDVHGDGHRPGGLYGNVALAKGTAADGTVVYDDDLAYAFGSAPKIAIVKAVNALDPLHPTSIERSDGTWRELFVGTKATFTYLVTNTGNIRLLVSKTGGVVDDNGTPGNPADDFFAAVRQRRHQQRRLPRPDRDLALQGRAGHGAASARTSTRRPSPAPSRAPRRPSLRRTRPATSATPRPRA